MLGGYFGLRGHFLIWQEQARDGAFENWEKFPHYILFSRCHNFLTFSRWVCLLSTPVWSGCQAGVEMQFMNTLSSLCRYKLEIDARGKMK